MAILEWLGGPDDGKQFLTMGQTPPPVWNTPVLTEPPYMMTQEEIDTGPSIPKIKQHTIVRKGNRYLVLWDDYKLI